MNDINLPLVILAVGLIVLVFIVLAFIAGVYNELNAFFFEVKRSFSELKAVRLRTNQVGARVGGKGGGVGASTAHEQKVVAKAARKGQGHAGGKLVYVNHEAWPDVKAVGVAGDGMKINVESADREFQVYQKYLEAVEKYNSTRAGFPHIIVVSLFLGSFFPKWLESVPTPRADGGAPRRFHNPNHGSTGFLGGKKPGGKNIYGKSHKRKFGRRRGGRSA